MTPERAAERARGRFGLKLLIAAVLVGVAATLVLRDSPFGADRSASRQRAAVPVSVSVDTGRPGASVPGRFLGLSFELSSLGQIADYWDRGDLVALLRSLGPGVLRFGGASADSRVAWTDALTPRPAWASSVLDLADLRRLRRLAARSDWRVLLTIGLAHYEPRTAAREAAAARSVLGRWLAGIEVGNEPDSYARHAFRPLPWSYAQYDAEVRSYRRAIASVAPGIALAGPGVSGSAAFRRWGPAEALQQRPALLTGHHYPLGCHAVPRPSIQELLSARTRRGESGSLASYRSVSRASAIAFRIDETNSVSCGGRPGISNTFASALWAVDYIAEAMSAGASGINFQGNPANCRGYSPMCASSPERLARGALHAQPEWYALLLTRTLVGGRPLRTTITSPGWANVAVTTLLARGGGLQFVIVENDPPGAGGAALRLRVGGGLRRASVLALSAPSPNARSGVELGGRAVGSHGSLPGALTQRQISARGGVVALTVPPSSAALVTVAPERSARH